MQIKLDDFPTHDFFLRNWEYSLKRILIINLECVRQNTLAIQYIFSKKDYVYCGCNISYTSYKKFWTNHTTFATNFNLFIMLSSNWSSWTVITVRWAYHDEITFPFISFAVVIYRVVRSYAKYIWKLEIQYQTNFGSTRESTID